MVATLLPPGSINQVHINDSALDAPDQSTKTKNHSILAIRLLAPC